MRKIIKKLAKIIIMVIILLLLLVFLFLIYSEFEFYRCWKIKLPGIQISKTIYSSGWQDGDEISIYHYNSKAKMRKMIEINNFEKISPENIANIRNSLINFYNDLSIDEKGVQGKEVYNKNISNEQLLKMNNYYLIKELKKDYIILILDVESKTLYTFLAGY